LDTRWPKHCLKEWLMSNRQCASRLGHAKQDCITESLEPYFLQASKAIYDHLRIPFGDTSIKLLALANGYALLADPSEYRLHDLERLVFTSIRYKKTLLIDNVDAATLKWLRNDFKRCARMQIVEVIALHPRLFRIDVSPADSEPPDRAECPHVVAIFPHGFLRRQAVVQRAQEYMVLQAGQDILPKQSVHIIGIGPNRSMLTERSAKLITDAPLVVTFDFVYEVISHLPFNGEVIVLDYDWHTYPINIERMNQQLALLHVEGHYDVTVVVEGHPEVYDLLSFLSLAGREYRFEVIAPAVTLCCSWITQHYGFDVMHPSYVIVSGYNARFGITTEQLALELNAYLSLDLTCLIIELYSGDIQLVFRQVQLAPRPKYIFILMNIFTPDQQIFMVSATDMEITDWVERIKGKFTSFAIVDEERLRRNPHAYAQLLQDLTPAADSFTAPQSEDEQDDAWKRSSSF
jgi:hypothetical protein